MTPTHEDLARDLAADLVLCEAAASGPWILHANGAVPPHLWVFAPRAEPFMLDTICSSCEHSRANLEMIVAARTGWPVAIRRALAAETEEKRIATILRIAERDYKARIADLEREIAALRQQVHGHADRIAAQSDLLSRRAEGPVHRAARNLLAVLRSPDPCAWPDAADELDRALKGS